MAHHPRLRPARHCASRSSSQHSPAGTFFTIRSFHGKQRWTTTQPNTYTKHPKQWKFSEDKQKLESCIFRWFLSIYYLRSFKKKEAFIVFFWGLPTKKQRSNGNQFMTRKNQPSLRPRWLVIVYQEATQKRTSFPPLT